MSDRVLADGGELEYEVRGSGEPVLFIHGAILADAFLPVLAQSALTDRYRLVHYHRRGFAGSCRPSWYEPLRAHAIWAGPLFTDVGPDADAARVRQRRAAERDPWRNGHGAIHALGPEGLPVTESARRRYLGDDLDEA